MLTLIKREIEDHLVYFIGTIALSAGIIALVAAFFHMPRQDTVEFLALAVVLLGIEMLLLCGMGASQMYSDRTRKISALLTTLAVSRRRVFTARVIAGLTVLLVGLVPVAAAPIVLTRIYARFSVYTGFFFEMALPIILLASGCYCLGLQCGWTSNKAMPTLGALGLSCIFITLFVIKGLGAEVNVILIVFIAASLSVSWLRFKNAAL